jgi:hypothetical protein
MPESYVVANTDATTSWNTKFFGPNFQQILRNALVSEKICQVDRSNNKIIYNPYSSQPTVEVSTLTGTYTPTAYTTTNDTLTVGTEFKVGEHVYDFERVMQHADVMMDRMDNQVYAIKNRLDQYVVNLLCEEGTGTYSAPTGGFTVAANIPVIFANLLAKIEGYSTPMGGAYLVIESTDVVGILQAQLTSGFSYSDRSLNNGFFTNYAGVDIYVVPSGTFVDATYVGTDTTSITNSGHRVFGVKGAATYAVPQEVVSRAFDVSGKTGKEISTNGLFGFKLWNQFKALTVDITVA